MVSTRILAALRNQQFLSLPELNQVIHEKLEAFNHKPFQKRKGSLQAVSSTITSRLRLHGRPNQYSTVEACRRTLFLSAHKVEQQGYKSCMALLRLAERYSPQHLENACRKALSYPSSPSLKSVQSI